VKFQQEGVLKMKRVLFVLLGCAAWACAQEAPKTDANELTQEERREKMQQLRLEMLRKNGPMVTQPQTGPGVLIRNMQEAVPHDVVTNVVDTLGKVTRLPFNADTVKAPEAMDALKLTREALASEEVGALVLLVDVKGWPSLWVAPEESWAIVNVDALRADNPDAEKFERRAQQQLWRGACYALGAGDSKVEKCVMNPVSSLADLDNLNVVPYPEYLGKMMQRARVLGMEMRRMMPYRKAVEEGWAEEPHDEIEKAIWDEIKNEVKGEN